jgi:hypothetical protein
MQLAALHHGVVEGGARGGDKAIGASADRGDDVTADVNATAAAAAAECEAHQLQEPPPHRSTHRFSGAHSVGRSECTLTPPDTQLKGTWYPGGFKPSPLNINPGDKMCLSNAMQPLRRYESYFTALFAAIPDPRVLLGRSAPLHQLPSAAATPVGLCTLNQVDP